MWNRRVYWTIHRDSQLTLLALAVGLIPVTVIELSRLVRRSMSGGRRGPLSGSGTTGLATQQGGATVTRPPHVLRTGDRRPAGCPLQLTRRSTYQRSTRDTAS